MTVNEVCAAATSGLIGMSIAMFGWQFLAGALRWAGDAASQS